MELAVKGGSVGTAEDEAGVSVSVREVALVMVEVEERDEARIGGSFGSRDEGSGLGFRNSWESVPLLSEMEARRVGSRDVQSVGFAGDGAAVAIEGGSDLVNRRTRGTLFSQVIDVGICPGGHWLRYQVREESKGCVRDDGRGNEE